MLTVKETDTHEVWWGFYEKKPDGTPDLTKPIDLTGATAGITIRPLKGKTVKEGFAGDPVDFTAGVTVEAPNIVQWVLPGDLAPTRYALVVRATKGGQQTTAPTSGVEILVVDPDLYDPEVP